MNKLILDDDLKIGKEEILLDPTKSANKCGSLVTPLIANDIMIIIDKTTEAPVDPGTVFDATKHKTIGLMDFSIQRVINISGVNATVTDQSVKITWVGDNKVEFTLDGGSPVVHTDTASNEHTFNSLGTGKHSLKVKAERDMRGETIEFEIVGATPEPVQSPDIQIEYGA